MMWAVEKVDKRTVKSLHEVDDLDIQRWKGKEEEGG